MGFWIFALLTALLIPFIMIFLGIFFKKTAPKKINYMFGYRTSRSMKNEETWKFAHYYLGKIWFRLSMAALVVSTTVMIFVIGKDKDTVGYTQMVVLYVQLALLIGSIFPVESALKKNFDGNGNKKTLW